MLLEPICAYIWLIDGRAHTYMECYCLDTWGLMLVPNIVNVRRYLLQENFHTMACWTPINVSSHPQFCPCPRRGKWFPSTTISSVEYKWPVIPSPKITAHECKTTYSQFIQDCVDHRDPDCFRAIVFANVLSN